MPLWERSPLMKKENIERGKVKILRVKVKPNSKTVQIQLQADGSWLINLKAPPVDGKANQELVKVLAEFLAVKKSQITIKSGTTSKYKLVEIDDS